MTHKLCHDPLFGDRNTMECYEIHRTPDTNWKILVCVGVHVLAKH